VAGETKKKREAKEMAERGRKSGQNRCVNRPLKPVMTTPRERLIRNLAQGWLRQLRQKSSASVRFVTRCC